MSKKLSEMTLEELWQLFPIILTEHRNCWQNWYKEETALLKTQLPADRIQRISHIGSTAVPTIWAKPIIDILIEVPDKHDLPDITTRLTNAGYICMSREQNRVSLNKGYTEHGFAERVFHLHLRIAGDHNELYFRDFLIDHPDIAKEYERIKLGLWKRFEHDRDGYTNAKTEFVVKYTREAKKLYRNRY